MGSQGALGKKMNNAAPTTLYLNSIDFAEELLEQIFIYVFGV